jgi:hypothetical protein
VLVLGQLAGTQHGDGWFRPKAVAELFERFHLAPPGNISQDLGRLKQLELVTSRKRQPSWSLTPRGRESVKELIGSVDAAAVMAELAYAPGAQLGHALHTVIPPTLAPVKWQAAIQRMLRKFDFDTNVFCMTRFADDQADTAYLDPVEDVIPMARETLARHGLTLHVASDRQLDDDLYGNVAAHMWACRYGVGLFEDRLGRGLNENMIIEVGSMVITGRRCALLKDTTIEKMPTDFVGHIYKDVDFTEVDAVSEKLHRWAAVDLGLGPCTTCPDRPSRA